MIIRKLLASAIGLSTKADSVIAFDDLEAVAR
jgi:hypothetical protein